MNDTIKVGIDLGTTNTLVCYEAGDGSYQCLNFGRSNLLPSVLFIEPTGKIVVGSNAVKKGNMKPRRMIKSAKTHMGEHKFFYPSSEKGLSFETKLSPTDVAVEVLKEVKRVVEKQIPGADEAQVEAVITVPAYFTANQIDETTKAGERAGFIVKRTISEPTAAAIAYVKEKTDTTKKMFVVDFGGGTLDLSILEYNFENGEYECCGLSGDNKLGGDNIDELVTKFLEDIVKDDIKVDISSLKSSGMDEDVYWRVMSKIREEAVNIKTELSNDDEVEVNQPDIIEYGDGEFYPLETVVTKEEFDEICSPVYERFEKLIRELLEEKNIQLNEIDRVLLVGGSCYIPKIREIVMNIFGQEPYDDIDLSTAVATGAAILANSAISEYQKGDILAYSFGIEVLDGKGNPYYETMIAKNTSVPCSEKKLFTTSVDNQQSIVVNIYENPSSVNKVLDDCSFYGSLDFNEFEKGKRGVPKIEINFEFKQGRRLFVTVSDLIGNKSKKVELAKGLKIEQKKMANPMDIFLLVDASGSMRGEPMRNVKSACSQLINELIDLKTHRVGVIEFGDEVKIDAQLSHNSTILTSGVSKIDCYGGTYMGKAINLARETFINTNDKQRDRIIILLTDGAPNSRSNTELAAKTARDEKIRIISIGAGSGTDAVFLKGISSVTNGKSDFYQIEDMSELPETFKEIAGGLNTL